MNSEPPAGRPFQRRMSIIREQPWSSLVKDEPPTCYDVAALDAPPDRDYWQFRYEVEVTLRNAYTGGWMFSWDMRDRGYDGYIDDMGKNGLRVGPLSWDSIRLIKDRTPPRGEPKKYKVVSQARPKWVEAYHGTKGAFDQLEPGDDGLIWLTVDERHADYFAHNGGVGKMKGAEPRVIELDVNTQGFLVVHGGGRLIRSVDGIDPETGWSPYDIAEVNSLPGIVFRNVMDCNDEAAIEGYGPPATTVIAVRDASRLRYSLEPRAGQGEEPDDDRAEAPSPAPGF